MKPPLSNALLEQDCRIAVGPPWLEHIHASLLTAEMMLLLLMAPRGKQDLELSAGCRPQGWLVPAYRRGSFAGFQGAKTPACFKPFSPLKAA